MAKLIITIEEDHSDDDFGNSRTGIGYSTKFEDLQPGDVLPGLAPVIMRVVQRLVDNMLGGAVEAKADCASLDKLFIN